MQTQKLLKINILFVTSNNLGRLCPFGFVMPTFKHKYQCFLILVQSFRGMAWSVSSDKWKAPLVNAVSSVANELESGVNNN